MLTTQNIQRASTRKIHLVFISGLAGSGKTTVAEYLKGSLDKKYSGDLFRTEIKPLAEPIKELAKSYFKWDGKKDERGRKLLQVLGTDVGRNYNPTFWIEKLEESINDNILFPNFVFVDDWRFSNEADYFSKGNLLYSVDRVRVYRGVFSEAEMYTHASETSLPLEKSYYDFAIDNNGTLEELYGRLDELLAYLETKIIFR